MYQSVKRFLRASALWILLLPSAVSFLGAASNQLVLFANNDTFPVQLNTLKILKAGGEEGVLLDDGTIMLDSVHCVMTPKTHLNLLADIFDFHASIESVGDLLLELGDWLSTFCFFVWAVVLIGKARRGDECSARS